MLCCNSSRFTAMLQGLEPASHRNCSFSNRISVVRSFIRHLLISYCCCRSCMLGLLLSLLLLLLLCLLLLGFAAYDRLLLLIGCAEAPYIS